MLTRYKQIVMMCAAIFGFFVLFYFLDMANKEFSLAYEKILDENIAADAYCEKAWLYCVSGNAFGLQKQFPTEEQCVKLRTYDSATGAKLNRVCPPIPLTK